MSARKSRFVKAKTWAWERDWRDWALFLLLGLSLLLAGCVTGSTQAAAPADPAGPGAAFTSSSEPSAYGEISGPAQELAQEVARWLKDAPGGNRIAVTTFVDVNDLTKTSAFGRAMTDALMAYLYRQGFEVIELRKPYNFLIEPRAGEFYLSRNVANIAAQHDVSAVLVGTYTDALNIILISARLISAQDGQVLSTSLLELSKTPNIAYLVGGPGTGAAGLSRLATSRRAPKIPPPKVDVYERPVKGSSKFRP